MQKRRRNLVVVIVARVALEPGAVKKGDPLHFLAGLG